MYLTRNLDYQGSFHVERNVAYDNGINGLVVHKTNNATAKASMALATDRVGFRSKEFVAVCRLLTGT